MTTPPEIIAALREVSDSISGLEHAVSGLCKNMESGFEVLGKRISVLEQHAGSTHDMLEVRRSEIETGFRSVHKSMRKINLLVDHIRRELNVTNPEGLDVEPEDEITNGKGLRAVAI